MYYIHQKKEEKLFLDLDNEFGLDTWHQEGFGSNYVCGLEYVYLSFLVRTSSKNLFALALCGHWHVAFFVLDNVVLVWFSYVVCVLDCIVLCGGIPCPTSTLHNFHVFDLANCCVMIWCRMDEKDYRIDEEDCTIEEEDHAINTIVSYTVQRYHVDLSRSTFKEWLLRAIGGESGANYIHRLLSGNHPDLCRKVCRIEKDVFTHHVSIFIERGLLKEGRFVITAEIVAITLFILVRGTSYQEAEDLAFSVPHQR